MNNLASRSGGYAILGVLPFCLNPLESVKVILKKALAHSLLRNRERDPEVKELL